MRIPIADEDAGREVHAASERQPVGPSDARRQVGLGEETPGIEPERGAEERRARSARSSGSGPRRGCGADRGTRPGPGARRRPCPRGRAARPPPSRGTAPGRGRGAGQAGRVPRVLGAPRYVRSRPGERPWGRMSLRVTVPPAVHVLEDLAPDHAGAIEEPDRVVIEGRAGVAAAGVGAALVRRAVVVGQIEVLVVEETVDHDQVVRLVARLDAGDADLTQDAMAPGHDQRQG